MGDMEDGNSRIGTVVLEASPFLSSFKQMGWPELHRSSFRLLDASFKCHCITSFASL